MFKEFILHNLGCTNCAAQIETAVKKLDGVFAVSVVFATKTMVIEMDETKVDSIIMLAKALIGSIEADVVVQEKTKHDDQTQTEDNHDHSLKNKGIRLLISGVFFAAAITLTHIDKSLYLTVPLYLASFLLSGGMVLLNAGRNITKGRVFDENFLMSIATMGAFAIGSFDEGVAVMLFFKRACIFRAKQWANPAALSRR